MSLSSHDRFEHLSDEDVLAVSRTAWSDVLELPLKTADTNLDSYALNKLDDKDGVQRELSLMLGLVPISKRQGKAAQQYRGIVPQLQWPCYQSKPRREKLLRVVMSAMKCKGAAVGTKPEFILLCASALAILQTERLAFRAVIRLYDRFKLGQYLASSESIRSSHLHYDSKLLWERVQLCQPSIADAFSRNECEDLFYDLMAAWLPNLFICTMDLNRQPISAFLPLLNRVVEASFKQDPRTCMCQPSPCLSKRQRVDAREGLRAVALCVLTQQREVFLKARSRSQMEGVVARLSTHVPVDNDLLTQIDKELCRFKFDLTAKLDTSLSWLARVLHLN
mmetsp:Transcript_41465/g.79442  ORF Transcript_41465/g.79442 Transcript_41465/m.79442 type:complete len:336 (-) Transcript_41465:273-1280(-)